MRIVFLVGVILLLALGLFGFVESQQVITTTTTRVITVQPTTYTTQTVISGTTVVATISMPGYTLVFEIYEPGQVCTVTFTALPPPTAMTIPGTTVTLPGTTFSSVITVRQFSTAFTSVVGGTTATRTGFEYVTITMDGFALPMIVYGVSRENCNPVTVTEIIRYVMDSVPATMVIAYPATTFSYEGTTITGIEAPTTRLTTTFTETREGTTYSMTSRVEAVAYTSTQVVTPTTVRETVTVPGRTTTETFTTVITLQQQTTPRTPTTPATTTTPPATTPQTQTTPAPAGISITEMLIPVAVIVVLVAVLLISLRLRR